MPIHNPSCIVASPREYNRATSVESATADATASTSIARKPASLLELRAQLRAQLARNQGAIQGDGNKPELRTPQPAMEGRRQRVLAMLDQYPDTRYAVLVDNPDTDPVLLTLAIRGQATCELAIPAAKFDPFKLLAMIDRHGAKVH